MKVEEEMSSYVHMKMEMHQKQGLLDYQSTPYPSQPSSIASSPSPSSKFNAAVLFIIVILAVLFFISGLLHLLIRFLTKSPSASELNENNPEGSSSDTLQRQLQQLFHLHDSGLDQSFIDALPVFTYKEIVGSQDHFDCAVCLCEFLDVDKMRLLPMCGHAFHMGCIDTWLLSNSTCPLCRGALLNPGFYIENPMFDFDDFMEEDDGCPNYGGGNGSSNAHKRVEIEEIEKEGFPIRLGKFRKLDDSGEDLGDEITGSSKLDARRCYSMGSYQYVVGNANLRVSLRLSREDPNLAKTTDDAIDNMEEGKKISIGTKTDSYSVSKIWLWSNKAKFASSSSEPQQWMHRTTQGF